jgi:hypothetical protein
MQPEPVPSLEPDWTTLGLVLSGLGSFLLGNAILFRRPRELVRERFGLHSAPLVAIREQIFHRLQVGAGFVYLLGGFALQLLGRFRHTPAEATFPVFWIALVAIVTVALGFLGWLESRSSFRRYVKEHLSAHPGDLEVDATLAREVGELFDVESNPDDTLQSYLARIRQRVGLPEPGRRAARDAALASALEREGDDA